MERPTDRQERISWWRQDRLDEAKIAVIGAGALGNEVLKNLALMGVGTIHVFDFDVVEVSNLSRTVLFGPSDLGKSKAVTAALRAKELNVNPKAVVEGHHLDVVWELGGGFLRRMSVVLGCLDNMEARKAIGSWCYQLAIPYVDGGIRELGGRVQLHLTGQGGCMGCTIGESEWAAISQRYSCGGVMKAALMQGVSPTVQVVSAFIAALMCQEAIKALQGQSVPFGSVLSWHGEINEFDRFKIPKRAGCAICGQPPIRPIRQLMIGPVDTVSSLLDSACPGTRFLLPSAFIPSFKCGLCQKSWVVNKPSFKCKETEFVCSGCDSAELVQLERIHYLDKATTKLLDMRLADLGIPDLAILQGTNGEEVTLFECCQGT